MYKIVYIYLMCPGEIIQVIFSTFSGQLKNTTGRKPGGVEYYCLKR